jgi:CO/xanthine dehydrogenase FAD-binding subunit
LKPPPFQYEDPETVDDALRCLASGDDDPLVLAGGQSLIPLLNLRLARPERLVDINRVAELDHIVESEGAVRIGALTRQRALERSPLVARRAPLLAEAIAHIGHPPIRARGTVGGSLAHADPAAELPVACVALDAIVHVRSTRRAPRRIPARELFVTHMTTALEPDELLCEIEVPGDPPGSGSAFVEFARRHGDFALGGAAARVALTPSGECTRVDLALLGAAPTPVLASGAAGLLVGRVINASAAEEAARAAVLDASPTSDGHGSSEYRQRVIATTVRRALLLAADRARP